MIFDPRLNVLQCLNFFGALKYTEIIEKLKLRSNDFNDGDITRILMWGKQRGYINRLDMNIDGYWSLNEKYHNFDLHILANSY